MIEVSTVWSGARIARSIAPSWAVEIRSSWLSRAAAPRPLASLSNRGPGRLQTGLQLVVRSIGSPSSEIPRPHPDLVDVTVARGEVPRHGELLMTGMAPLADHDIRITPADAGELA